MPRGIPRAKEAPTVPVENRIVAEAPALSGAPEPTRSPRAEQTRRERRRREDGDLDRMGRMALAIPPEVQERLDREGKTARWVRDDSKRQRWMHRNDWDVTPDVEAVSEARDSEAKLVLMEKYRDWYNDDQAKKSEFLDRIDDAIERGEPDSPEGNRPTGGRSNSYAVPGNRITRETGR